MAEANTSPSRVGPHNNSSITLTIDAGNAKFAEAVRSALPGIRASLPKGCRLDVRFVEEAPSAPVFDDVRSQHDRPCDLTTRQREIVDLLSTGLSNKAIGRKIGLSHFTVRNHIAQIMRLLGVSTRQDVVAQFALFEHETPSSADFANTRG